MTKKHFPKRLGDFSFFQRDLGKGYSMASLSRKFVGFIVNELSLDLILAQLNQNSFHLLFPWGYFPVLIPLGILSGCNFYCGFFPVAIFVGDSFWLLFPLGILSGSNSIGYSFRLQFLLGILSVCNFHWGPVLLPAGNLFRLQFLLLILSISNFYWGLFPVQFQLGILPQL
jgi:hypothetical protein